MSNNGGCSFFWLLTAFVIASVDNELTNAEAPTILTLLKTAKRLKTLKIFHWRFTAMVLTCLAHAVNDHPALEHIR